jgi:hypothetical protein
MIPAANPKSPPGIIYGLEKLADVLMEGKVHAAKHWWEFGARRELRSFDMDYELYLAAENKGNLLVVVSRRDGEIIGYLIFILHRDQHAKGGWAADSGFYYTIPHPMRGLLLRGMIRCGVKELLSRGIVFIRFRHRLKQTARPILENLGFELDELSYSLNVEKFRGR